MSRIRPLSAAREKKGGGGERIKGLCHGVMTAPLLHSDCNDDDIK